MGKKLIQHDWDFLLLNSWKRNPCILNLMRSLSILHNPDHNSDNFTEWCFAQNLKRFPKHINRNKNSGDHVRWFIGRHCPKLNQYLFDKVTPEQLLPIIDTFYWENPPTKVKAKRTKVLNGERVKVTEPLFITRGKRSERLLFHSYASKNR